MFLTCDWSFFLSDLAPTNCPYVTKPMGLEKILQLATVAGIGGETHHRKSLAAKFCNVPDAVPINWMQWLVAGLVEPIAACHRTLVPSCSHPVQTGNLCRVVGKLSGLEKRPSIFVYMLNAQLLEKK